MILYIYGISFSDIDGISTRSIKSHNGTGKSKRYIIAIYYKMGMYVYFI